MDILDFGTLLTNGPQSGFKKETLYDRLSLSMAVPFAHIRNAISTHYNPFVVADVYKCKWYLQHSICIKMSFSPQVIKPMEESDKLRKNFFKLC